MVWQGKHMEVGIVVLASGMDGLTVGVHMIPVAPMPAKISAA